MVLVELTLQVRIETNSLLNKRQTKFKLKTYLQFI